MHDAAFPGQPSAGRSSARRQSVTQLPAADLRALPRQRATAPGAWSSRPPAPSTTTASSATLKPYSAGSLRACQGPRTAGPLSSAARGVSASRSSRAMCCWAFEGPSYRDPEFFTAQVFSGLFGGGMSSRLFQEVRERRGLCYSIYSSAWGLERYAACSAIHAATGTGHDGRADRRRRQRAAARWPVSGPTAARDGARQGAAQGGAADEPGKLVGARRADGAAAAGPRPAAAAVGAGRGGRGGDGRPSPRRSRRACCGEPAVGGHRRARARSRARGPTRRAKLWRLEGRDGCAWSSSEPPRTGCEPGHPRPARLDARAAACPTMPPGPSCGR